MILWSLLHLFHPTLKHCSSATLGKLIIVTQTAIKGKNRCACPFQCKESVRISGAPQQDSSLQGGGRHQPSPALRFPDVSAVNTRKECLLSAHVSSPSGMLFFCVQRCPLRRFLSSLLAGSGAAELTCDLSGSTQIVFWRRITTCFR